MFARVRSSYLATQIIYATSWHQLTFTGYFKLWSQSFCLKGWSLPHSPKQGQFTRDGQEASPWGSESWEPALSIIMEGTGRWLTSFLAAAWFTADSKHVRFHRLGRRRLSSLKESSCPSVSMNPEIAWVCWRARGEDSPGSGGSNSSVHSWERSCDLNVEVSLSKTLCLQWVLELFLCSVIVCDWLSSLMGGLWDKPLGRSQPCVLLVKRQKQCFSRLVPFSHWSGCAGGSSSTEVSLTTWLLFSWGGGKDLQQQKERYGFIQGGIWGSRGSPSSFVPFF